MNNNGLKIKKIYDNIYEVIKGKYSIKYIDSNQLLTLLNTESNVTVIDEKGSYYHSNLNLKRDSEIKSNEIKSNYPEGNYNGYPYFYNGHLSENICDITEVDVTKLNATIIKAGNVFEVTTGVFKGIIGVIEEFLMGLEGSTVKLRVDDLNAIEVPVDSLKLVVN